MVKSCVDSTRIRGCCAFTLVELLIVVVILAIVAAIVVPSVRVHQDDSEARAFMSNLRHACDQFILYQQDTGDYPNDVAPGVMPDGMADRLTAMPWTSPTPIKGQWDWDFQQFGFTAGVSVFQPDRTEETMAQQVDAFLDDGNLLTGGFRQRPLGYIRILEP
ncbi:MAG: type IV pilin protein [Phycisphaerae bacterium]